MLFVLDFIGMEFSCVVCSTGHAEHASVCKWEWIVAVWWRLCDYEQGSDYDGPQGSWVAFVHYRYRHWAGKCFCERFDDMRVLTYLADVGCQQLPNDAAHRAKLPG